MPTPDKSLAVDSTYPLTPMQQGMLYHGLREPGSGVDIEQILMSLYDDLDRAQFKEAWRRLTVRHDVLRTRFRWEDVDAPVQDVLPAVELPVVEEDWGGLAPPDQEARLAALLQRDRHTDFDFSSAPLMRIHLLRLGEKNHRVLWTFHHALLDGRSFPILLQELFAIYENLGGGAAPELAPAHPFRDHVDWLGRQDFDRYKAYWAAKLRGFSHATPFHVDRIRRPAGDGGERDYREQALSLSSEETAALRSFAQRNELTVNTLVQGAWAILLSRYSGEAEVVFGATRACRSAPLPDAAVRVGLFINTLPLRVAVDPERTLLPWLEELRADWVDLREYEHTPLARIQGWSELHSGAPLFESILVFENNRLNSRLRALGGSWLNREFAYFGQTNFPLTVMGYLDREMLLNIGYDRRRFSDETIARMLGHLRVLLLGMVAAPETRLADLPMLTEPERHQLLVERNPAQSFPVEQTLTGWFEAMAARAPASVAVSFEGQSLTYRELNERANQVAWRLLGAGVRPGALVGLCLERSLELVVGLLGILKAGAAYLPLDLAYPADRLAFMLEDAGAPALLTQEHLLARAPGRPDLQVICVDRDAAAIARERTDNPPGPGGPDALAYVIYTSGSTGQPKGVKVSHANVVRLFEATQSWFGFNESDVWTLFHSSAFDFSVWEIWGAWLYGGRLVVVPYLVSRSPEAFYDLVIREGVTVLNQTPSAFHSLAAVDAATPPPGPRRLRYVIFGGEALELSSLRPWFDRHGDEAPRLINMYGITETTVHVTYRPLSRRDLAEAPGSVIGEPIPDLDLYILDKYLQPVPIGVPGELYVGGAGVSQGYLNRDELTAQRFIPNPFRRKSGARLYKTGDVGRFLPSGDIEYLGRADDQVKIRGFRIELGEIEAALGRHPAVAKAVVMARSDAGGAGKRLVAYLVPAGGVAPAVSELRDFIRQSLPDYMIPAAFVTLERLPLTPNGKVDRRALPEPEPERPDLATAYAAPATPVEQALAAIWSEVLRVPRVGIHDNYFELGGDSILSIQIVARARRAGLRVNPQHVFKHPTVAELARLAQPAPGAGDAADAEEGMIPLTPIQRWFFEQDLKEVNHWNQAFIVEVDPSIEARALESGLREVARRHGALRLRFARTADGWRQECRSDPGDIPLDVCDLTGMSEEEQRRTIASRSAAVQSGLHIEHGPLWRAAFFNRGPGRSGRLLLAAHHLAVDGVSWGILIEDLAAACRPERLGAPTARTSSFRAWAERLVGHADAGETLQELDYWLEQGGADDARVPVDFPDAGPGAEASARTVTVSLDPGETEALLQKAPAAWSARINDLLVTALARAITAWTGRSSFRFDMEGHGREALFEDVDVSRTIGWFTSIFPVHVRLDGGTDLASVAERMQGIPRRGIGYGLLKYSSRDPAAARLRGQPAPDVLFNYLGQFDRLMDGAPGFRWASESSGPWHGPGNARTHLLEINCWVRAGRLEAAWTYNETAHRRETIERRAADFIDALRRIARDGRTIRGVGPVPPGVRPEEWSALTARVPDMEDAYPLSPMQDLFYSMGAPAGFEDWELEWSGPLDAAAFRAAWSDVVGRHPALRTAFVSDGLARPMQAVLRESALPWRELDWRGVSAEEQAERRAALLAEEESRGFDLASPPMLRVTLARITDHLHYIYWCSHHLVVDGWSWPLILRDVMAAYPARRAGRTPGWPPAPAFRGYLYWLERRNESDDELYWRKQLAGLRQPTRVAPARRGEAGALRDAARVLDTAFHARLGEVARQQRVTVSNLVQAAWALVVHALSGESDILLGVTVSGRPAELDGVEETVGSFVNSVPLRLRVEPDVPAAGWVAEVSRAMTELVPHQHTALPRIQAWSDIPPRLRLFENLFIFQNYQADEEWLAAGDGARARVLTAREVTNYPLTAVAHPGPAGLTLKIKHRLGQVEPDAARAIVDGWAALLEALVHRPSESVRSLLAGRSIPRVASEPGAASRPMAFAAAQSDLERTVAGLWQRAFSVEQVGVDDNFFDLGGHSLLLVSVHRQLQEVLGRTIPIVVLFQYPTIRALARHLSPSGARPEAELAGVRQRAERQRQALDRMRARSGKKGPS
jgi:amino acid adenylation domain-containing protein/non-ribosomal peptide synthase protein (TIGR01720 family)